ncbi:hypothetical protein ACFV10_25745 [Streptomyces cyaneofuscatus]|uniref:hypothetical protein n=1 Tax=Streptomyces cyaneofuscatus TaxID=66883 RepID=UPI00368EA10E
MTASAPAWVRARPSERARAAGAVVVEGAVAAPVQVVVGEVVEAGAVVPAPGAAGEEVAVVAPGAEAEAVEGAAAVAGEEAAVPVR